MLAFTTLFPVRQISAQFAGPVLENTGFYCFTSMQQ